MNITEAKNFKATKNLNFRKNRCPIRIREISPKSRLRTHLTYLYRIPEKSQKFRNIPVSYNHMITGNDHGRSLEYQNALGISGKTYI